MRYLWVLLFPVLGNIFAQGYWSDSSAFNPDTTICVQRGHFWVDKPEWTEEYKFLDIMDHEHFSIERNGSRSYTFQECKRCKKHLSFSHSELRQTILWADFPVYDSVKNEILHGEQALLSQARSPWDPKEYKIPVWNGSQFYWGVVEEYWVNPNIVYDTMSYYPGFRQMGEIWRFRVTEVIPESEWPCRPWSETCGVWNKTVEDTPKTLSLPGEVLGDSTRSVFLDTSVVIRKIDSVVIRWTPGETKDASMFVGEPYWEDGVIKFGKPWELDSCYMEETGCPEKRPGCCVLHMRKVCPGDEGYDRRKCR